MRKKLLLLLTVCLTALSGLAQTTVTFTAGTDKGSCAATADSPAGADQVTKDGITIAISNGALAASPYRIYKNQTLTVSSTVGKITKVVITCSANGTAKYGPGCFANPTAGSYTYEASGKTGTWTGDTTSFSLTASTNQVRATKIEVTYTPEGDQPVTTVATPTFDPNGGEVEQGATVKISCATEGTEIYYTTDSTEPSDESTEYTEPIPITEDCTIKAIAYTADGQSQSAVATTSYTVKQAATYETVTLPYADLTSSLGKFTVEDVTNNTGKDIWVWNSSYGAKASAYISGTKYETESNLVSPIIDLGTATKPTLTFSHAGRYFASPISSQAKLKVREEGGEWSELTIDKWFTGSNWTFVDATVDLSAYVGKKIQLAFNYNSDTNNAGTWEIKNLKVQDASTPIQITEVSTIAEYKALEAGTEFKFTGSAVVAYAGSKHIYIKDATGGALIYGVSATVSKGQVLNPGWTGTKTIYYGLSEITSASGLEAGTETQEVTPAEMTLTQVTTDHENEYAVLRGVTISDISKSAFNISLNADTLAGYNSINGISLPSNPDGKTYDVEGFVSQHNGIVQFAPISFTNLSKTSIGTVAEANALSDDDEFQFSGKAVVVYQSGKYLYVRDGSGAGLIYGEQAATFTQGQVLNAGWSGTKTTYNGVNEFKNVTGLTASADTQKVDFDQKFNFHPEQVTTDMQNQYILLDWVNVTADTTSTTTAASVPARAATDSVVTNFTIGSDPEVFSTYTATIAGHNAFKIDMKEVLKHNGQNFAVEGLVGLYNGAVSFYPTKITFRAVTAVSDVNAAKAVKAVTYYNLAGQASATPFEGLNIVRTTYSDGTTKATKVMKH